MAKNRTTYEETAEYAVRLSRPVRSGAIRLLPGSPHIIKGKLLNRLIAENGEDVIDDVGPAA